MEHILWEEIFYVSESDKSYCYLLIKIDDWD
jgi:hypothetical protein